MIFLISNDKLLIANYIISFDSSFIDASGDLSHINIIGCLVIMPAMFMHSDDDDDAGYDKRNEDIANPLKLHRSNYTEWRGANAIRSTENGRILWMTQPMKNALNDFEHPVSGGNIYY